MGGYAITPARTVAAVARGEAAAMVPGNSLRWSTWSQRSNTAWRNPMTDLVCEEGVTRKGEYEPCDKPAVAERWPGESDEWPSEWYPVCPYHTRGTCRPLQTG